MKLDDLKIYQLAMEIGNKVWNLVNTWDNFKKDTIGKQLVRSADSVAANISEGYGRYHYKDSKNFYYYSRGSLYETKTWLTKAFNRGLIQNDEYNYLSQSINTLGKMLNSYIKSIGNNQLNEPKELYQTGHKDKPMTDDQFNQ